MPRRIIYTGRNQAKAAYQAQGAAQIAQGVQETAAIFAGALQQYHVLKQTEEANQITLLHGIIDQYGEQAGQPALEKYDRLLRKKGIGGLPRNSEGKIVGPPPRSMDQMILREAQKDPKILDAYVRKQSGQMSTFEVYFKQMELDRKKAHDAATEKTGEINAAANVTRALAAKLKGLGDSSFPGIALTGTGELKPYTNTSELTGGERPLTVRDARAHTNRILASQLGPLRVAEENLKKTDLELKKSELANDLFYGPGFKIFGALKMAADGKLDSKNEDRVRKMTDKWFDDHGIRVGERPAWWERVMAIIKGAPPQALEQIQADNVLKGLDPAPGFDADPSAPGPKVPEVRKLKSGKMLQEEVVE